MSLFCDTIQYVNNVKPDELGYTEQIKCNEYYLKCKLDTGSDCNVLPVEYLKDIKVDINKIQSTNIKLSNYNGSKINNIGEITVQCEFKNKLLTNVKFQVVKDCKEGTPVVLGIPTIQKLNLLTKTVRHMTGVEETDKLLQEYESVFDENLGEIKNVEYDINLIEGSEGKVVPCRKIPFSLLKPLKNELDRLEKLNIIKKVEEPTDFVNGLVIVKKADNSIRVCIDPQHLNKCIKREHFKLPTFEEIAAEMIDAKLFSILDATSAFHQLKLTEKSSKLCTVATPFGRYRFLKMPYGLSPAPEVFHKEFSYIFEQVEGVTIFIDDILVRGRNKKEHDERLRQVLEIAKKYNIKFNLKKCKISVNKVKYLGHVFTDQGILPDENKIDAIIGMKNPTNVKQLETFLGMVTYISKFLPNISTVNCPLRELIKKGSIWKWEEKHSKAIERIKEILIKKPVLQYYDPNKAIVLSVDASKDGLGAVMLQNNLPVSYASQALTDTQKAYAQIEKEMLAIVFGCKRFHQYIVGRHVFVESDHRPLENIFKKPLNEIPLRLQRMMLQLQNYDIEVQYKPGKELYLADALSRNFINNLDYIQDREIEAHVGLVLTALDIPTDKIKTYQSETNKDETLKLLKTYILEGWPNNKTEVHDFVKPYYNHKHELFIINNLIFKNNRLVIPQQMRREFLKRIHYNHLGMDKCKNRARESIFWPGLSNDIENTVSNCETCLKYTRANIRQPMLVRDIPNRPWSVLGSDTFYFRGNNYVIVVDYFSKFVEIAHLRDMTTTSLIIKLKMIFSRHGIPDLLYTDNGTNYCSEQFKKFSSDWNFKHKTSSPYHQQSNGLAERNIQTIKKLLKKAYDDNKDPYLALLEFRTTPINKNLPSPAELLYNRKINGLLPNFNVGTNPIVNNKTQQQLTNNAYTQKYYYDRGTRERSDLETGTNVYVNNQKSPLSPGKIVNKKEERPRSYNVLLENGRKIERNQKHLFKNTDDNFKLEYRNENITDIETVDLDSTNLRETSNIPLPMSPLKIPSTEIPVPERINKNYTTKRGRLINKPRYLNDYVQ